MTDTYRIRSEETWERAKADYLAGGLTAPEVCERYDLSLSTFRRQARDGGWRRTDADDPEPPPLAPEDDDGPAPDLEALIDLAWRRQARAAAAGRLAEARGWLDLWSRYRSARLAQSREPSEENAQALHAMRRATEAGIAAAKAIKDAADADHGDLSVLMAQLAARESGRAQAAEVDEIRHDRHDRHPLARADPTVPPEPSRLRRSLLEATVAKAVRSGDPARIARARSKLEAYLTQPP
jgi:hypothetical protein